MAQVYVLGPIPVRGRHRVEVMPLVVGGVVDQRADRTDTLARLGDRRAQRVDIYEIAWQEQHARTQSIETFRQLQGRCSVDVEERDPRMLPHEGFDDRGADAGCAARHQDDAVAQARINRGRRQYRHSISLSVSGSNRHALFMSTVSRTVSPTAGTWSASKRAVTS